MTYAHTPAHALPDKVQARARTARRLARWVKLGLSALVLGAIWQERALAPSVHDRMQMVYAKGLELLDRSEEMGSRVAATNVFQIGEH